MILFVDTETTGIVDYKAAPDAPHQPRLVQLALLLSEADRYCVRARASLMIYPEGWVVPPQAEKVHGLSTELCQRCGIPLDVAWSVLYTFASHADLLVAHSAAFDRFILDGEWLRRRYVLPPLEGIWYCTKEAATPVLKLPSKHPGQEYGWPSLGEAHNFFCGIGITGAHDALVDAEACARVYYALQSRMEAPDEQREPAQAGQ